MIIKALSSARQAHMLQRIFNLNVATCHAYDIEHDNDARNV